MKDASIVVRLALAVFLFAGELAAAETAAEIAAGKAQTQLAAGKPEAALPILEEALKAAPKDLELGILKALALQQADRPEAALAAGDQLVREHPDSNRAIGLYGSLLNRTGQPRKAVSVLEERAESQLLADSHVLGPFGEACLRTGQLIRAQRALLRAIEAEAAGGRAFGMAAQFAAATRRKDCHPVPRRTHPADRCLRPTGQRRSPGRRQETSRRR